jgi:outer membrane protein assembly factor BamA
MFGRFIALFAVLGFVLCLGACEKVRPERLPGETDIVVTSVTIQAPGDEKLEVEHEELFMLLGLRPGNALITNRYYNEFRLAEDRRRLVAWWQTHGHFDVVVDEPKVDFAPDKESVAVTWTVHEGVPYRIGSVAIEDAPAEYESRLRREIPFQVGDDEIDLEAFRMARHEMAWYLQRQGFGHATVYSRAYVDRKTKLVHWVYFVDTGPKTKVGKITVEGANKIPEEKILYRGGATPGDPYSLELKERIEEDLLDSGAFASVVVKPLNADVERVLPGVRPDTGGELKPEQVDEQGNLVPRKLPEDIDFRLVVVEAPSVDLELRAGAEADPTRADAYGGASLWLRNFFAPYHHLVLEGRLGYGWLWGGEDNESSGAYGEALIRTIHAGLIGRLVDARLSGRFRDVLYPGSRMRELSAGPGLRAKLARHFYFDLDALFRYEKDVGLGPFTQATRDAYALPDTDTSKGGELDLSLILDERNDHIEPMKGYFFALRSALSPEGSLGTHRYAFVGPDARVFLPLGESTSLALRSSWGFVLGEGAEGVPLGPRLFGGGAFGMRGFGRDRLSPAAPCAGGPASCSADGTELVGGLSLMESQAELRFLPFRKQTGLAGFVDAGAAGPRHDPFSDGISLALGVGPRVRLWYVPIALDFSYRFVRESETQSAKPFDPYLVFLRIGEAF